MHTSGKCGKPLPSQGTEIRIWKNLRLLGSEKSRRMKSYPFEFQNCINTHTHTQKNKKYILINLFFKSQVSILGTKNSKIMTNLEVWYCKTWRVPLWIWENLQLRKLKCWVVVVVVQTYFTNRKFYKIILQKIFFSQFELQN